MKSLMTKSLGKGGCPAVLAALGLAFFTSTCLAQTNLAEYFESGNLDKWTAVGGSPFVIDKTVNIIPSGGAWSAKMTSSANRMYRDLTDVPITAQSAKFTYWYYDDSGAATRGYCEVRYYSGGGYGSGSAGQVLAIGKYTAVGFTNSGVGIDVNYDNTKYQGRIAFGNPSGWFNLNAPGAPKRSTGWHRFDIERGPNTAGQIILSFYVDGQLGRVWTNSNANTAWNTVVMGFGAGSTVGPAWYDGIEVISGQAYIKGGPDSTAATVGQPASLSVDAIGEADGPYYQWIKNGTNLVGATDAWLNIASCTMADGGNYTVVVSNYLGMKTSAAAVLTVNPLTLITVPPANQMVNLGSNAVFYAEATGNGTLYYQWQKNGVNIPGAMDMGASSTFTIRGVTANDAASYSVTVTNDMGDPPTTSGPAILTVNMPPTLTSATNQSVAVSNIASLRMFASDDFSSTSLLFQDFETNSPGQHVMFCNPSFSGGTSSYLDAAQTNYTVVTNVFPAGHGGTRVLNAHWVWSSASPPASLRLTTAGSGVTYGGSPIISYTNRLRFDICSDNSLKVALGVRDTSPTGAIGSTDTTSSGQLEWIGVGSAGSPPNTTNIVPAGVWTNLIFDPVADGIASAYGVGNGVLDSTTGRGVLEHLGLVAADGQAGSFNVYLDNFVQVADKPITFALNNGPADAAIDPFTGIISWAPTNTGNFSFTVTATDFYRLTDTRTFTVTVNSGFVPPGRISISLSGTTAVLNWDGSHTLQWAPTVTGPWNTVPGPVLTGPYTNQTAGAAATFFRLQN